MAKLSAILKQPDSFLTEIRVGNHIMISDEPLKAGGSDQGPDPILMMYASLAACTLMTLKMYLNQKNLSFKQLGIEIEATSEKIENTAVLTKEEKSVVINRRLRRIHKTIKIEGIFTGEQLERMKFIADKCPVNLVIRNGAFITSTISSH